MSPSVGWTASRVLASGASTRAHARADASTDGISTSFVAWRDEPGSEESRRAPPRGSGEKEKTSSAAAPGRGDGTAKRSAPVAACTAAEAAAEGAGGRARAVRQKYT